MQNHTGLRGLLAWWVVVYHAQAITGPLPLVSGGDAAVDIFFLLSGFALAARYPHLRLREWPNYMWRRWLRIYPLHLITLLALTFMVGIWAALGHTYGQPQQLGTHAWVANVLLVHAWSVPLHLSWNYPAWSISAEWLAYLAFAPLARVLARWQWWMWPVLLALPVVPVVLWHRADELSSMGLLRLTLAFPAGVLLSRLAGSPTRIPRWVIPVGGAGLLLGAVVTPLAALPGAALLIIGLARHPSRLFSQPALVSWGEASYALYITHALVLMVVVAVTPALPVVLRMSLLLACTAAVAWLAHHRVDVPLRAWLAKQRFTRWRTNERHAHGD